jgi:NDP-sugar pyrophosphorylase family protein
MRYIDYGLSVFQAEAFDAFPADQPFDLADVMRQLVRAGHLAGFEVHERFYEIGSPTGLAELEAIFAKNG